MRARAIEIRWHDTQPVFSVDFCRVTPAHFRKQYHPYTKSGKVHGAQEERLWRLATAGGDNHVRTWLVHSTTTLNEPSTSTSTSAPSSANVINFPRVEYLATLAKHTAVVNVVRFSPKGDTLASAGDDGCVILWVPSDQPSVTYGDAPEDREYEKEFWKVRTSLKVSPEGQIYDLAWSPDGEYFLTGCTDNTARIHRASDFSVLAQITEHNNYVQGVAWDPLGQYIATQSSDRSMHIYSLNVHEDGRVQVHAVGKNTKMEMVPRRESLWSGSLPTTGHDKTKETSTSQRSHQQRPASRASDSDRSEISTASQTKRSKDEHRHRHGSDLPPPPIPSSSASSSMPPPPVSRRSSFGRSVSASPPISNAHHYPSSSRSARSPSPMPPLPAVMPPPSPKSLPATSPALSPIPVRLYGDESSTPFFRRLSWSTDGSLLLTPAGLWEDPGLAAMKSAKAEEEASTEDANSSKAKRQRVAKRDGPKPTVYIYSRSNISKPPVSHLPGHKTTSLAIRFCPVLWELRGGVTSNRCFSTKVGSKRRYDRMDDEDLPPLDLDSPSFRQNSSSQEDHPASSSGTTHSVFDLPYRMVYAVVTHDAVFIYDTQQAAPLCMLGNLHFASFTDVCWSPDGNSLILSSQDGYCSAIAFEPGELGTPCRNQSVGPTFMLPVPPPKPEPSRVAQPTTAPAPQVLPDSDVDPEPKPKKRRIQLQHEGPT